MPDFLAARRGDLRPKIELPSLNFLLILLIFAGTGAALAHDLIGGRFPVFVFVVSGWVVSLCLHEFGHAATAYYGGDKGIARTGYLSLDPMRYSDPALSVILPIVYVLIGGFGLPGGAVYIRTGMLRSRGWVAIVAAAGPAMNLLFLIALSLISVAADPDTDLSRGLAALALFQVTAIIINLLPIPGLDGFGVLRPFLAPGIGRRADELGAGLFLVLFLLMWLTPLGRIILSLSIVFTRMFGFEVMDMIRGMLMLRLF